MVKTISESTFWSMENPKSSEPHKVAMCQQSAVKMRKQSNTSLAEMVGQKEGGVDSISKVINSTPLEKQGSTPPLGGDGGSPYEKNNNHQNGISRDVAKTKKNNDASSSQETKKLTNNKAGSSASTANKDVGSAKANGTGAPDSSIVSIDKVDDVDPLASVVRRREQMSECFKVSMLVSSRLLYSLHLLLTIWRLTVLFGDMFWIATSGLLAFLIDILFVLVIRKGKEWTWFQPIVLFYLLMELPCIWLMELHKVSTVQVQNNQSAILGKLFESTGVDYLSDLVDLDLSNESWALLLEQSMLVFIVIARWMMPKGDLTRDQLSALLLTYIGVASDVVDFFSVLAEDTQLLLELVFVMTILSTWSWSMFQFMFVTSMTRGGQTGEDEEEDEEHLVKLISRTSNLEPEVAENSPPKKRHCAHRLRVVVESEVWGIVVSLFMQDGPFVVVRLVCLLYWKIKTYTNYFFTAKNILVLLLQIYRLVAVYHEHQRFREEEKEKKKRTMVKIFNFLSNNTDNTRKRSNSVSPIGTEHLRSRRKDNDEEEAQQQKKVVGNKANSVRLT